MLLSLVLQLRSHADPDERMYGLMATVAAAALAIVAGGYLAAEADAVTVGAVAVAVAVLARALPLPTPASVVVALLAAAGAGVAVGAMTGLGTSGALLGAGAAVCALIGHRVAGYDYPSRFVHFTAGVALPLAAAAPAVYVLGRALAWVRAGRDAAPRGLSQMIDKSRARHFHGVTLALGRPPGRRAPDRRRDRLGGGNTACAHCEYC